MEGSVGPRVYSCSNCGNHVCLHDDIISKAFHGRHGRAFLFSHGRNIVMGPKQDRLLMTGIHTVADVYCHGCGAVLGWKYERAYEETQSLSFGHGRNLHLKKLVCDGKCWRHLTYLLEDEQLGGGERRRFEMGATHGHGSLQTLTTTLFPCNGRYGSSQGLLPSCNSFSKPEKTFPTSGPLTRATIHAWLTRYDAFDSVHTMLHFSFHPHKDHVATIKSTGKNYQRLVDFPERVDAALRTSHGHKASLTQLQVNTRTPLLLCVHLPSDTVQASINYLEVKTIVISCNLNDNNWVQIQPLPSNLVCWMCSFLDADGEERNQLTQKSNYNALTKSQSLVDLY
ncbi:hypothetical protein MUK42_26762 [Musa troglodytarum]|uniref:Yippee domain-containing protein n=1 Tax=Musa troglodytarum TaxID=320322 RepID=A0A9E7F341_9LILI|nr:hypothetical protein MUK42_26762 [Musa troglodytarum]